MISIPAKPIHVVFAADFGYYQHLCVALVSILENNRDVHFHVYVLTGRLSDEAEAPLKSLQERYDNLVLVFREVDDSQFAGLVLNIGCITVQTYYRYILARLFPELDRVLYLDCDLCVRGSLKELWEENLDGYYAAGIVDRQINNDMTSHLNCIGFQGRSDYCNAGVMLFNLKAVREDNIVDEFFSCHRSRQSIIQYQDQDVVNMVLKGRIKLLPSHYNLTTHVNREDRHIQPIIVHYTGHAKPWYLRERCRHLYKNEYYKYLLLTPYARSPYYFHIAQWWCAFRDFIFSYKVRENTIVRIKIFGVRVYKKSKKS